MFVFVFMKKGVILGIIFLGFIFVCFSLVNAKITGKAQQGNVDVSLQVGNAVPAINFWEGPWNIFPIPDDSVNVDFEVTISDDNGYQDISSVTFDFTNEGIIKSGTCIESSGGGTIAIYSCSVDMDFYDIGGASNPWTITIYASDGVNNVDKSSDYLDLNFPYFIYGTMLYMKLDTSSISWGAVSPDSVNLPAINPIKMSNIANTPISGVHITGHSLGHATSTEIIDASSFGVNEQLPGCVDAQSLAESVEVEVAGASLQVGDYNLVPEANQDLYFCLINLGSISTGSYTSGDGGGSWSLRITDI